MIRGWWWKPLDGSFCLADESSDDEEKPSVRFDPLYEYSDEINAVLELVYEINDWHEIGDHESQAEDETWIRLSLSNEY